jgi:hypothetical protein
VQASTASATRDQITSDFKVGTGRTVSFLAGSTLDVDGAFSGSPSGGTLDLSLLTLSLPPTVRITGTTDASDASGNTGAVGIAGGLSVAKRLYVGTEFILATNSAPVSSTSSGVAGMIRRDNNFIYVCIATNTWKRVLITSW